MTKQRSRKILLLTLPILLWYLFSALSKDCLWKEPHVDRFGAMGIPAFVSACGFPFEYQYFDFHPWNHPLQEGSPFEQGKFFSLTMFLADLAVALAPICLWFYSFRKLHSVSKNQGSG